MAENAGHGELEDGPEVEQAVLDRRSGESESTGCRKGAGGAGILRGRVFDVLRLVEDDCTPPDGAEFFLLGSELGVVDDEEVSCSVEAGFSYTVAVPDLDADAGKEAGGFGSPVVLDRLRADYQGGAFEFLGFTEPLEPAEGLEGFSEAHVVGEHPAEAILG